MDGDDQEIIYCEGVDEFRNNCDICDSDVIERYYKNHSISRTLINIIHKRQRLNISSKNVIRFEHNKFTYQI